MINSRKAEKLVKDILVWMGEDPNREGLQDTPSRVVKSWSELYSGYHQDPAKILSTTFMEGTCNELVLCKDIEFYSTCEHHMLPIVGIAHVGYVPSNKIVGLSKLPRLVEIYARRLQVQEKLTNQISDAIQQHLSPRGVGVVIKAKHFCMCERGVNKQNSMMTTYALLGALRDDVHLRKEFFEMCKM